MQRGVTACEMLAARATGFSLGAGHVGTFCLELTDIPDSQEASSSAGQSGHREPLLLGNARALLGFRLAYASHGPHWGQDSRFGLSVNDSFCSNRRLGGCGEGTCLKIRRNRSRKPSIYLTLNRNRCSFLASSRTMMLTLPVGDSLSFCPSTQLSPSPPACQVPRNRDSHLN